MIKKKVLVGFTGIFIFQNFSQVKMDNLQIIDFTLEIHVIAVFSFPLKKIKN